jgi:hypothetical protein
MHAISPDQVLVIYNYRRRLDPESQWAEISDMRETQPAICKLIGDELADFAEGVRWLGWNVAATIWRLFESDACDPVPRVGLPALAGRYASNKHQVFGLSQSDRRVARRALNVRYERQPHVLAMVEKQCLAYGKGSDKRPLGEVELGTLFALMGAITDALHQSLQDAPRHNETVRFLHG